MNLDDFARDTLRALGLWRLPVDPERIAREEGIDLAPGKYGEKFDARIEYVPTARSFILYYREAIHGRTEGRVRFSLAHELGHFYIPEHREYLLRGQSHNSVPDFRSTDPREAEADEFASALLMPRDLFAAELKARRCQVCNLADLRGLADGVFKTSITSTARRYCHLDWEPCAVIVSEDGKVKWARHSESMRALGLSYIKAGTKIPGVCPTGRLWRQGTLPTDSLQVEGAVDAEVWYERSNRHELWEEAMPLGQTGFALTFLAAEESEED